MAHSPWTIPNTSEGASAIKTADAKKNISAAKKSTNNSFASVMANEQGTKTSESKGQSKPVVARLPEGGLPLRNTTLAGRSPNDMLRMQNFNKANADIAKTRSLEGLMGGSGASVSAMDMARNMGKATNLRTIAASNNGAGFALSSTDFIRTRNSVSKTTRTSRSHKVKQTEATGLGKLSARFESGSDGIAAIGYDRNGGTSYGKYQIASRVGSMNSFLSFLDSEAPDLSKRLRKAGPSNTGSRSGKMPEEWRKIAQEQPDRFEKLQESFIRKTHYDPALESIGQRTKLDTKDLSPAMREVVWSTAVQHGPAGAARIFAQADSMSGKSEDAAYERKLISNVYNLRSEQFGSSSSQVRNSVRNRFRQEKQMALKMLQEPTSATLA